MTPKIEIYEYRLPDYIASYVINSDPSGLEDSDIKEIDKFVSKLSKKGISIVGVEDDSNFYHSNDLNNLGADCSTFIAHKIS